MFVTLSICVVSGNILPCAPIFHRMSASSCIMFEELRFGASSLRMLSFSRSSIHLSIRAGFRLYRFFPFCLLSVWVCICISLFGRYAIHRLPISGDFSFALGFPFLLVCSFPTQLQLIVISPLIGMSISSLVFCVLDWRVLFHSVTNENSGFS